MTRPGHIFIVDDDRDFVAFYRELLEAQGLLVTAVHSVDAATETLEARGGDLDVVLLDQKLQGPGGPDTGLELIGRITQLAPFAKIIVVTGYARPEAIERAFKAGVYDYLVKNGAFEALLTAKVRNAVEVTRERRLATLSREQAVSELRTTWMAVKSESDANRKGALLEELVKLLFRATPGFERVSTRLRNDIEELDVTVENRSDDPLWKNEGPYFLVECKNWSSRCGAAELRNFVGKFPTKYARVRVGFFVAPGGFADTFEQARQKLTDVLLIAVDGEDLQRWIEADDRVAILAGFHQRAVFDSAR